MLIVGLKVGVEKTLAVIGGRLRSAVGVVEVPSLLGSDVLSSKLGEALRADDGDPDRTLLCRSEYAVDGAILGNNDVSGGVVLLDVEGSIEGCGDESWLGETD